MAYRHYSNIKTPEMTEVLKILDELEVQHQKLKVQWRSIRGIKVSVSDDKGRQVHCLVEALVLAQALVEGISRLEKLATVSPAEEMRAYYKIKELALPFDVKLTLPSGLFPKTT